MYILYKLLGTRESGPVAHGGGAGAPIDGDESTPLETWILKCGQNIISLKNNLYIGVIMADSVILGLKTLSLQVTTLVL